MCGQNLINISRTSNKMLLQTSINYFCKFFFRKPLNSVNIANDKINQFMNIFVVSNMNCVVYNTGVFLTKATTARGYDFFEFIS